MQWAQAISARPYEAYTAPRISPFSQDQNTAFNLSRNLGSVGNTQYSQAQQALGSAQSGLGSAQYTAQTHNSPYTAATYDPSQFKTSAWSNAGPQGYLNSFNANVNYDPAAFKTSQWSNNAANQYMDPYINNVMNTVLARQQDTFARDQNSRNASRTASGAFGGLRQGVEDAVARSEFNRNTAEQEAGLLSSAYQNAQGMFTSDQARGLQAQQLRDASNQFSANLQNAGFQNAQQMFSSDQARKLQTQQLQEGANQFGANFNDASKRAVADNQFRFNQLNDQNAQQQAQIAQQRAQGLASIAGQYQNFGNQARTNATQNIDALNAAGLQQQRQTQAGLDMGYDDFVNQRDYEMQMLNFYNSIIRGMPITSNTNVVQSASTNPYSQSLGLGLGAAGLYNALNNNGGGG